MNLQSIGRNLRGVHIPSTFWTGGYRTPHFSYPLFLPIIILSEEELPSIIVSMINIITLIVIIVAIIIIIKPIIIIIMLVIQTMPFKLFNSHEAETMQNLVTPLLRPTLRPCYGVPN